MDPLQTVPIPTHWDSFIFKGQSPKAQGIIQAPNLSPFVTCWLYIFQDKQFGKVPLFFPHSNPEAEVTSGIKHYKQYSLTRAYMGETFFWGLLPQPGDQLMFKFTTPIFVKR